MMKPEKIQPGPGEESVWDYPRPPRVEPVTRRLRVAFNGVVIAHTTRGWRVLETSHPPVYYFPAEDIRIEHLLPAAEASFCEWKGTARYFDVAVGGLRANRAAWSYPDPVAAFASIRDHVAFYPQKMDACFVDDDPVRPQPGSFYGGWISRGIVGPFKGEPGSAGW